MRACSMAVPESRTERKVPGTSMAVTATSTRTGRTPCRIGATSLRIASCIRVRALAWMKAAPSGVFASASTCPRSLGETPLLKASSSSALV